MPIRELARAAGVSPQTIQYYVREGLLPPPTKTAKNMAYKGPEHVAAIRLFKELAGRSQVMLASWAKAMSAASPKGGGSTTGPPGHGLIAGARP